MSNFSLSYAPKKVLPQSVIASDGMEYAVNADFRVVLRCLRVCNDPDIEARDAIFMIGMWFFGGVAVPDAEELFLRFFDPSGDNDKSEEAKMDFEQDADAIYASFLMDYGIDLLDVPFLHWYKFRVLLSGLSEATPLQNRIQLRSMDTSSLKGKEKAEAEKAKRKVRLVEKISEEEQAWCDELEKALREGRDPSSLIEKLKNR